MKKLFLASAIALFGMMNAQNTGFKLGAHVGLPVGDASSAFNFIAGADVSYLWPVADSFNLGLTSGYSIWFGKDLGSGFKVLNTNMVPIAATGEYYFSPQFSLAADLGYAFTFVSGSSSGGFYYQPKVAYHFGKNEVNLGYMGISANGGTSSAINLGYAYSFGK